MEEERVVKEYIVREDDEVEKKRRMINFRISLKSVLVTVLVIVLLTGAFFGGFRLGKYIYGDKKLGSNYLIEQIKECSDLIVAETSVTNTVPFEKGAIPVISKKSFEMFYVATINAGIDIEKVKIDVDGKKVIVKTPHAEIIEKTLNIKTDKLKFFNDKGSLFRHRSHTDVKEALDAAKDDAMKEIHKDEVLTKADEQIVKILKELLHFVEESGYKLKIEFI